MVKFQVPTKISDRMRMNLISATMPSALSSLLATFKKRIAVEGNKLLKGIAKYKSRIHYYMSCFLGYCPTPKEIENKDLKKLASRLNGESYKETLSNILEWQERNIEFWSERWPIYPFLLFIMFSVFILLVVIPNIQIKWWLIAVSASSAVTVFSVLILLLKFIRKIPTKEGLKNTFLPSISINPLLKNRLGVCKDYAKLTACLLLNIYPSAEIYLLIYEGT